MEALLLVILCAVHGAVTGPSSVPFITPCHANDLVCMKSSAQRAVPQMAAGLPELDIRPLDPIKIEHIEADQAGLSLEFRKTTVKGLRNCAILHFKRNAGKQSVELKCSVTLVGNYTIGGKLIMIPVEGDGKYKIKIRDIVVKVSYEVITRNDSGVNFWSLKDWNFSYDVKGGAEFQFQNLFGGNKQLSQTVHQFANSSWKEIFQEVAPPIVKAIVGRIIDEVRKLFDKVPIKDLAID